MAPTHNDTTVTAIAVWGMAGRVRFVDAMDGFCHATISVQQCRNNIIECRGEAAGPENLSRMDEVSPRGRILKRGILKIWRMFVVAHYIPRHKINCYSFKFFPPTSSSAGRSFNNRAATVAKESSLQIAIIQISFNLRVTHTSINPSWLTSQNRLKSSRSQHTTKSTALIFIVVRDILVLTTLWQYSRPSSLRKILNLVFFIFTFSRYRQIAFLSAFIPSPDPLVVD